ncbi:MAG: PorV/PorQ family protein [Candidatus Goldbacteria bacterium]|nr:PorV/PorQ family protein [Candidatus Goldiibacteriota bacterium]
MTKKFFVLILLFMISIQLLYGAAGVTSVFDVGLGVRSQSLGGAYVASTDDSSSIYHNPSGLNTLKRTEVLAAYNPLFYDTNYGYVVVGVPTLNFGTFGFSFATFNTDEITLRDFSGTPIDVTTQSLMEIIAGWGGSVYFKELQFGLNLKFDFQSFYENSDTGFGADLGFLYLMEITGNDRLNFGLVLRNLIEPQIKIYLHNDYIPRQCILGMNYTRIFNDDFSGQLLIDFYAPFNIDFVVKTGLEVSLYKMFSLRLGYDSYGIYSFGAGIELFNTAFVDYGFFVTEIGTQHRMSLRFAFGESIIEKRLNKEKVETQKVEKRARLLAAEELKNMREKIDQIAGESRQKEYFKAIHYTRGLENYYDGNLKMSLIEFETVFQADQNYMNTRYYISLIKNIIGQSRDALYNEEIIKLYRSGVEKYVKEDYKGAKREWEKILELDPYNRLAIENLREVNAILRNLEENEEK